MSTAVWVALIIMSPFIIIALLIVGACVFLAVTAIWVVVEESWEARNKNRGSTSDDG